MHEVDRRAQALPGGTVEHAGLENLRTGVATALTYDVVDVEHLVAVGEIPGVEVDSGATSCKVSSEPHGHGASAQGVLANVDAGIIVGANAHALQVLLGVGDPDDLHDRDARPCLCDHPQKGGRGRDLLAGPGDGDDDGGPGSLADHDARIGDLALVGVDRDHDGFLAHGACGDLDVACVRRLRRDPLGDLVAHARLNSREELRQREVDVALAGDLGNRERDVIGVQAVPGLRRRPIDTVQGDRGRLGCLGVLAGH